MFKSTSLEKQLEWKDKILEQKKSGLSMTTWCLKNQIPVHAFKYWKYKFHPITRSSFMELKPLKTTGICLEYKGVRLHVDPHFDPKLLKHCLILLKELPC